MNIGALRRRITIQKKSVTQETAFGTEVITWLKHADVWASVNDTPLKTSAASDSEQRGKLIAYNTTRTTIRIRYLSTVTSDMRILLTDRSNKIMQIVSGPIELGNRDGMEFVVVEYTS